MGSRLLVLLLLSLGLTVTVAAFVLGIEPGLQALGALAFRLSGGRVQVGAVSVPRAGRTQLRELRYDDGVNAVTIDRLVPRWQPGGAVPRRGAHRGGDGCRGYVALGPGRDDTAAGPVVLPDVALPLDLRIDSLALERLERGCRRRGGVRPAGGAARPGYPAGRPVHLDDLRLTTDTAILRLRGQLRTAADYLLQRLAFDGTFTPAGFTALPAAAGCRPLATSGLRADHHRAVCRPSAGQAARPAHPCRLGGERDQ